MHFWMSHARLQHLHIWSAFAPPALCTQCHVGAPCQHTLVEVSITVFLNGTHLPKTSWRKDLLAELKRQLSTICKSLHWTRHWNRYREEVYCGWPQLLPGNCLNNRNISFFFLFYFLPLLTGWKPSVCTACLHLYYKEKPWCLPWGSFAAS